MAVKVKNQEIRGKTVGIYVTERGQFIAAPEKPADENPDTSHWQDTVRADSLDDLVKKVTVKLRVKAKVLSEPYAVYRPGRSVEHRGKIEHGIIRGQKQKYPRAFLVTLNGKKQEEGTSETFVRPDITPEETLRLFTAEEAFRAAEQEYRAALKAVRVDSHLLENAIQKKLEADDEPEAPGKVVPIR